MECDDHVSAILDEIALEGLDGITLEGLWVRLMDRPSFQDVIDDSMKKYVWSIILKLDGIEMYELPEPRNPLVVFNRYDFVDPEFGIVLEPEILPVDLYPHSPVEDAEKQIRGSCKHYFLRSSVLEEASKLGLDEVLERWGNKFVMVARQDLRDVALMGYDADPELELTIIQYCILERIGRSRFLGEVTQGKVSLQTVVEDPKALFYHRKFLTSHGLIVKQIHHQKTGTQNCSGSLLHLPRFYVERRPKVIHLTERVVEILKHRENYLAEYDEIRKELALSNPLRKLFQTVYFQRFVRTDLRLPYRTLYPDAKTSEWKLKGRDKEKTIRVLQLIDPNTDVMAVSSKDDDLDLGDDDDNIESIGAQEDFQMAMNTCYLSQVHDVVEKSGANGLSQQEISTKLGLTKLHARTVSRNLLRREMASIFMNDVGRQRVTRFRAKVFGRKHIPNTSDSQDNSSRMDMNALQMAEKTMQEEASESVREQGKKSKYPSDTCEEENSRCKRLKLDIVEDDPTSFNLYEMSMQSSDSADLSQSQMLTDSDQVTVFEVSENGELVTVSPGAQGAILNESQTESSCSSSDNSQQAAESQDSGQSLLQCTEDVFEENYDLSEIGYSIVDNKLESNSLKCYYAHQVKETPNMTYRVYKRINLILEFLKTHRVIDDYSKLLKLINKEEEKEGLLMKIDRKSLFRLIFRLNEEGYLNVFSCLLTDGTKDTMFFFICEPSITIGHPTIQLGIERARMKMFIVMKEKVEVTVKSREDAIPQSVDDSADELKAITCKAKNVPFVYDKKLGRKYGLCPKFIRMRTLHQFLFYLIYDYQGNDALDQEEMIQYLTEKEIEVDASLVTEMSKIYFKELSWKMFIPPLRKHGDWPYGWTVMCDVLLRLPLSIFVKIFNVCYVAEGIEDYLNDPVRKHFLVKHLPVPMRNCLMASRKYIFSIYDVLLHLCYVGLIQFGPQRLKEKDQVLIYLNRKASLVDTVPSKPGYHQISEGFYEVHTYEFKEFADVHKFWYDMWNICVHTRLGGRMCVQGKDIVLESLSTKPAMVNATQPRKPEEAPELDVGKIPGDKKGAAGLDSALFSHLKRNWNWTGTQPSCKKPDMDGDGKVTDKRRARLANVKCDPVVFNKYTVMVKKSINFLQSGKFFKTAKHDKKQPAAAVKNPLKKGMSPMKGSRPMKNVVRRVQARKKNSKNRPFYDEVDMSALQLMSKLRVEWSTEEDNLLLICKVASMYLCPNPRQQVIGFNVVRDVLHQSLPCSMNKTSKACQRRILYVMKNPTTSNNVAMHLEEVKQDPYINKMFGNALANLKSASDSNEKLEIAMNKKFKLLVAELRSRSVALEPTTRTDSMIVIPDSLQEFWDMFEVLEPTNSLKTKGHFKEVTTLSDIYCALLNTIIMSSLCCPSDKTSFAYQLFKVYQQYPDSLLRSAMAKVRADQMASLKKSYVPLVQKTNYLPLSSSPYQLSANYVHLIQTKYQHPVYHESFLMARSLLEHHGSTPDTGMKTCAMSGGYAAALLELFQKDQITFETEIPEQVIILDPRISEIDESYARIVERYRDILQNYKPGIDYATSSLLFKKQVDKYITEDPNKDAGNPAEEDPEGDMEPDTYLPECSFSDVGFEEAEPAASGGEQTETPVATNQQTMIARAASRIALFMMREELGETTFGSSQHAHDFFVVNACQVYCKVNEQAAGKDTLVLPLKDKTVSDVLDSLKRKVFTRTTDATEAKAQVMFVEGTASPDDWQQAKNILDYVRKGKEVGVTMDEMREMFHQVCKGTPLVVILASLTDSGMLLRTGVVNVRYVHRNYAHHWLVHSHKFVRLNREKCKSTNIKGVTLGGERDANCDGTRVEDANVEEPAYSVTIQVREKVTSSDGTKQDADVGCSEPNGGRGWESQVSVDGRRGGNDSERDNSEGKDESRKNEDQMEVDNSMKVNVGVNDSSKDDNMEVDEINKDDMRDGVEVSVGGKVDKGVDDIMEVGAAGKDDKGVDGMEVSAGGKDDKGVDDGMEVGAGGKDDDKGVDDGMDVGVSGKVDDSMEVGAGGKDDKGVDDGMEVGAGGKDDDKGVDDGMDVGVSGKVDDSMEVGAGGKDDDKGVDDGMDVGVSGKVDDSMEVGAGGKDDKGVDDGMEVGAGGKDDDKGVDDGMDVGVSGKVDDSMEVGAGGKDHDKGVDDGMEVGAGGKDDDKGVHDGMDVSVSGKVDDSMEVGAGGKDDEKGVDVGMEVGAGGKDDEKGVDVDMEVGSGGKDDEKGVDVGMEVGAGGKDDDSMKVGAGGKDDDKGYSASKEDHGMGVEDEQSTSDTDRSPVKKMEVRRKCRSWRRPVVESSVMERIVEKVKFSDSDKIEIIIRPWIRVNGTVNRRVLDRMLGAVLGHLMFMPGQSLKACGQRFSPAMQPFHVRELIEMLQELGCVKLSVVRKSCQTTLFSKPSFVHLDPADGTEDEASIMVEPQPDAVLRLGQFIGDKAYAQDFLCY